jgi:Ribonuclease G/E
MSASIRITCDFKQGLSRAAVWRGSELVDLYLDRADHPNLVGATACGKVVRFSPNRKMAFVDCGLGEHVSVQVKENMSGAGSFVVLAITGPAFQGKAWQGQPIEGDVGDKIGLLTPPPATWQRALADLNGAAVSSLFFENREDYTGARKFLQDSPYASALQPLSSSWVHPDLDDRIDALLDPVVSIGNGANLVIERTEALVAIDVNRAEGHPLTVNLLAAAEAARQIRLRNLSGVIMMDCLKMTSRTDGYKLIEKMKEAVATDPAKTEVMGLTKLGLLEMARLRRGPSLAESLAWRSKDA